MRLLHNQRIVSKAFILYRIGYDERFIAKYGVTTKRDIALHFVDIQTDA